jgi:hypothetical protein
MSRPSLAAVLPCLAAMAMHHAPAAPMPRSTMYVSLRLAPIPKPRQRSRHLPPPPPTPGNRTGRFVNLTSVLQSLKSLKSSHGQGVKETPTESAVDPEQRSKCQKSLKRLIDWLIPFATTFREHGQLATMAGPAASTAYSLSEEQMQPVSWVAIWKLPNKEQVRHPHKNAFGPCPLFVLLFNSGCLDLQRPSLFSESPLPRDCGRQSLLPPPLTEVDSANASAAARCRWQCTKITR